MIRIQKIAVKDAQGTIRIAQVGSGEDPAQEPAQMERELARIKWVTYSVGGMKAAALYEQDGRRPVCLTLEQAEKRYGDMERTLHRHNPCLAWGMTETERSYYYENGDPEAGKPLRRYVYQGRLPSGATGLTASRFTVAVEALESDSTVYIYQSGAKTPIKNNRKPYTVSCSYTGGDTRASVTGPLLALADTEARGQVCIRVYFEVMDKDEEWTYGVLELYQTVGGNCKLGRLALDAPLAEGGSPTKDPRARPKIYQSSNQQELLMPEGTDLALKAPGSPVDREGDDPKSFALWAYEAGTPFRGDLPPNGAAVGDWAEGPEQAIDPTETLDPEHACPRLIQLPVGAQWSKAYLPVRTEDPHAWVAMNTKNTGFRNYQQGFLYEEERVGIYDEAGNPAGYRVQWRPPVVELNMEAGPGERAATVYLHVKSQDHSETNLTEKTCGRMYEIALIRSPAPGSLVKVQTVGEDGSLLREETPQPAQEEGLTGSVELGSAQKWVWLRLMGQEGDQSTRMYVFRPDINGSFSDSLSQAVPVWEPDQEGGKRPAPACFYAQGECWVRLFVPEYGAEYRVVLTGDEGLQGSDRKEYRLRLIRETEVEA